MRGALRTGRGENARAMHLPAPPGRPRSARRRHPGEETTEFGLIASLGLVQILRLSRQPEPIARQWRRYRRGRERTGRCHPRARRGRGSAFRRQATSPRVVRGSVGADGVAVSPSARTGRGFLLRKKEAPTGVGASSGETLMEGFVLTPPGRPACGWPEPVPAPAIRARRGSATRTAGSPGAGPDSRQPTADRAGSDRRP